MVLGVPQWAQLMQSMLRCCGCCGRRGLRRYHREYHPVVWVLGPVDKVFFVELRAATRCLYPGSRGDCCGACIGGGMGIAEWIFVSRDSEGHARVEMMVFQ